jgi:serine protease Do
MEISPMAITSLQDVQKATVQIEARGTFVDPQFGTQQSFSGMGSGFIISEDGIAVTNNHVVTGAAILNVWVNGEDKPRNARILGVSECSDLAVIDIQGDGYQYLEWYGETISVGTDVYAAGFPFGDPEYTLTRGIVSKERANGEVSWASVQYVIEHDARINPGNSGGPLVAQDGKVIGINYASYADAGQYYAITKDEALTIIGELQSGNDVDSLGINGIAVADKEELTGIWVASVKSGSPADNADIQPGDIITKLEGMNIVSDGTMTDYCNVIRTHDPEDTLTVEVIRLRTEEILKGQINGQRLEVISSYGQEDESNQTDNPDFVHVTDDYGVIEMQIPSEWHEVDGSAWVIDGEVIGAGISASPNMQDFYNTWSESGVFFGASHQLAQERGYIQLLDNASEYPHEHCHFEGRDVYDDGIYEGKFDAFTNCGGTGTTYIVISAVPKANRSSYLILVIFQITDEADWAAIDQIVKTFFVIGDLTTMPN